MADFLLVHGAWHGAWCWRAVTPALVRAGHRVHALTLTGLGERSHLLHPGITLETHIQDVVQAIEAEEMRDLVLVGHSYAGMLATAIADRMTGRLSHLVYVDAVVPKPGESWSSTHAPAIRKARMDAAKASPLFAFPAPDPTVFGLDGPDHDWVVRRQTPHPAGTYEAPLVFDPRRVARVPRTFVSCTAPTLGTIDAIRPRVASAAFWDGAWLPGARVLELPTGHDPMISAPAALVDILAACADGA